MKYKKTLVMASIFGALAVSLGAFGAHGLKSMVSADRIGIFETGVRYQFYHTFGLFVVALVGEWLAPERFFRLASGLFIGGMVLFSGSLYLLACRDFLGLEAWTMVLGPMTPIGGLCLVLGWLFLGIGVARRA